jgi:hypothetical protein
MSTGPAVPQFIIVPRTGIQLCRRLPLSHMSQVPDQIKDKIWDAAQKIGVSPKKDDEPGLAAAKPRGAAANILLPLVAGYACVDEGVETTGWMACDQTNPAFFRLLKVGSEWHVDLLIDTQSGGGSMVSNRIPCIVSYGATLLRREQELCNFYVEDYTKPKNVVGSLVIDYGNSGCAAIFCPDDAAPGSVRAMALPTPFDPPQTNADIRTSGPILKSTMFVLWAPESELTPPWVVYGQQAEQLMAAEDPLITSLYAPKKYVRDWPEHLKALEPTTPFRGKIGQRDGLFPKQLFVQHGIDQLLELILAGLTNPNRASLDPVLYPQVRKLLLTYPLTWREAEKKLFRKMFRNAADRLFQHDPEVGSQFGVELVCSEPVAVATYALWEHLFNYYNYGKKGQNLRAPSLASSSLGNSTGEPRLRMLIVDIGGGSTDIALLDAHWEVVPEKDDNEHVAVTFHQAEWARFNRAGDRISHLIATAILEYMRTRYGIRESLDFEVRATNPAFTLERQRVAVSMIMQYAEQAKAALVKNAEEAKAAGVETVQPWRLSKDDEEKLKQQFISVITQQEDSQPDSGYGFELSLPVLEKWVELDRRSKTTGGEPGFMDIFVYLGELAAQCKRQQKEINLVILSGRTTRLPFLRRLAAEALGMPWHRIRTVGELLPDELKAADHAEMDKLAVVYGGHLFKNGEPIRFSFSESAEVECFQRVIGIASETPSGMRISRVFVSPGERGSRTIPVKVAANRTIRIGQAFREDSDVDLMGVLHNSTAEDREVDIDVISDFQVTMKRGRKSEGVTYTEWVSGGANDIRDNFNDTGRIDCEPEGFIRGIVRSNQDEWMMR